MKKNNKITEGAALLGISAIIVKIIGLIYKLPLSYILGDEGMGYFNSAYTVYTLFYLLSNAGIPKAITIIASKNEAENKSSTYSIIRTLSCFFALSGVIICALFFLCASPIAVFISNGNAVYAMYAVAPSIPFFCLGGVLRGYLVAKMKFLSIAFSELISGLSKMVFGLVFAAYAARFGMPLEKISAFTMLGITLGSILCLLPLVFTVRKEKNKVFPINKKETVLEALKITLPITLSSILTGIAGVIDLTLIMRGLVSSGYSETVATVIYGNYTTLAVPMFTLATTLIAQISTSLLPNIVQGKGEAFDSERERSINFALFLAFFISIPVTFIYFLYPNDVLGMLFEKGSVALGSVFLSSIAPSVILIAPLTMINTVLEASNKISIPIISLTTGSIVKLIISGFLIGNSKIGIFAASFGTFLSYLIPLLISSIYMHKKVKYRIRYSKCIFIPLFSTTVSVFCGLLIKPVLRYVVNERIKSFVFLLFIGVIYLVLSAILSKNTLKSANKYSKINKRTS